MSKARDLYEARMNGAAPAVQAKLLLQSPYRRHQKQALRMINLMNQLSTSAAADPTEE